ncbi:MAG: FG-GAP-like repeat-containing protein [Tepidisphaeraceae bacterium]|jgi:hypothetical protein
MTYAAFPCYEVQPLEARVLLAANVSFLPYQVYATGSEPHGLAVADLSNNGIEDIVTANSNDTTISVILGNGDGTFQAEVPYVVGDFPSSVAIGDVNGDGIPDIVVANLDDNDVDVLFGNGNGTFQLGTAYVSGDQPWKVALADLSDNGLLDIITLDRGNNTIAVLMNNGNGTFQTPVLYPVGSLPLGMAIADLNGDGYPDIVTSNFSDDTVSVLMNNGNGTFAPQKIYPVGDEPTDVAVGDFLGNGKLDIVTTNEADNTVSVLYGNGDGTFANQIAYPGGLFPYDVTTADLDNGRYDDIIVGDLGNTSTGIITVLMSNGNESYSYQQFASASRPYDVTTADLNDDGLPDIIDVDIIDDLVSVLYSSTPVTTGVTASDGTFDNQIQLNWNANASAVTYQVFRSTTDNIDTSARIASLLTTTTFDDPSVISGQDYYYWVRYKDSSGNLSAFSGAARGFAALTPPTNITASQGTFFDEIQLNWTAVPGATSYQIFRSSTDNVADDMKIAGGVTSTTYDDFTALPGQTYYYWVVARNPVGIGFGPPTPVSGFVPLAAPANIQVSQGTFPLHVQIAWDAVLGASVYQLFRGTIDDVTQATVIAAPLTNTYFDDTTATPGVLYYYWVRARNPSGIGLFNGTAADGFVPLAAPAAVAATTGLTGEVQITWNAVPDALIYQIFRSTTDDITTATKIAGPLIALSYNDTTAVSGQLYYYWVRARSSAGPGPFGVPASGSAM